MKSMLHESELRVLEILWNKGDTAAKDLAASLKQSVGWHKSTSYTVIQKCIGKGLIGRLEGDFICYANLEKAEAQKKEASLLADKMFNGSADLLIASLLGSNKLTNAQVNQLRNMVQEFSEEA